MKHMTQCTKIKLNLYLEPPLKLFKTKCIRFFFNILMVPPPLLTLVQLILKTILV